MAKANQVLEVRMLDVIDKDPVHHLLENPAILFIPRGHRDHLRKSFETRSSPRMVTAELEQFRQEHHTWILFWIQFDGISFLGSLRFSHRGQVLGPCLIHPLLQLVQRIACGSLLCLGHNRGSWIVEHHLSRCETVYRCEEKEDGHLQQEKCMSSNLLHWTGPLT